MSDQKSPHYPNRRSIAVATANITPAQVQADLAGGLSNLAQGNRPSAPDTATMTPAQIRADLKGGLLAHSAPKP
jgi:hypothetical protein